MRDGSEAWFAPQSPTVSPWNLVQDPALPLTSYVVLSKPLSFSGPLASVLLNRDTKSHSAYFLPWVLDNKWEKSLKKSIPHYAALSTQYVLRKKFGGLNACELLLQCTEEPRESGLGSYLVSTT